MISDLLRNGGLTASNLLINYDVPPAKCISHQVDCYAVILRGGLPLTPVQDT